MGVPIDDGYKRVIALNKENLELMIRKLKGWILEMGLHINYDKTEYISSWKEFRVRIRD